LELHNEAAKALEYPKKPEKKETVPEKKELCVYEEVIQLINERYD